MATRGGWLFPVIGMVLVSLAAGCFSGTQRRHTSSVVDYLYPKKKDIVVQPSVPVLSPPLNVGIAFVPEESGIYSSTVLSEAQRLRLMDRIGAEFKKEPFVKTIQTIPSTYLTSSGSFENLDQLKTMYGLDVVALLSYDQVQHTGEGLSTIWYWTLVGAYVVKGEKNSTNTMIDAAVFDINSRSMLFRAPGTSYIKASSTPVKLEEQLRTDSYAGFETAADSLVVNLQAELERFKTKIKETPDQVRVVETPEYRQRVQSTGGGAVDWPFAALFIGLGGAATWLDRKRRK